MSRIFLQRMAAQIQTALPPEWSSFDLASFSPVKSLWDYQQAALQHALRALWMYYRDPDVSIPERKRAYMDWYRAAGLDADHAAALAIPLDRSRSSGRKIAVLLETAYGPAVADSIPYENFANRIAFWMATGAGKTIVLVKLIELLSLLIRRGLVPPCEILVLAHRDDLLDQLRRQVSDYNTAWDAAERPFIRLRELKDYASARRETPSFFAHRELTVFYYRSDNLSDERKEKIVDFRAYDNDGRWFILLDEAHKGDKEDSKRQHIYSILSRQGFLFNFSATFTDPRDIVATVYNYNLSEFIRAGHGKHVAVLKQEVRAFRTGDNYSPAEKQKIVLKALLLLAYARVFERRVRALSPAAYHRPLLMTLVNSVNTEDADLKLFFRELARVGCGDVPPALWDEARRELLIELRDRPEFIYETGEHAVLDETVFQSLDQTTVLAMVFNASGAGEIEILVRPSNRQEVAFKLRTADEPFALVRIGDISDWLKRELSGYGVDQHFADESFFERLNRPDSQINLLLGSRSFYEGWDSNRPNVVLYINIGVGTDARKFILQSVGRGVRIEPFKDHRKRLRELVLSASLSPEQAALYHTAQENIRPLESLFILGTNRDALNLVLRELDNEDRLTGEHEIALQRNDDAVQGKQILIPVYRVGAVPLFKQREILARFSLSQANLDLLEQYLGYVDDDRVLLALHDTRPEQIASLRSAMDAKERWFNPPGRDYKNLSVLTRQALNYFALRGREFERFKPLEDEINHFRHIHVSLEDIGDLERRILRVIDAPQIIRDARARFDAGQLSLDELLAQVNSVPNSETFFANHSLLEIKNLANHYFIPLLLSADERIDYIHSIIHVDSEVKFLTQLEDYLTKTDKLFNRFDWWLFSRLDQSADDVAIPYYNPQENKIYNFRPDFVFWLQRGDRYFILFVDPKGVSRSEYQHKVDGYRAIFERNASPRTFSHAGLNVSVHLSLVTDEIAAVGELYRPYWYQSVEQMLRPLVSTLEPNP